MMETGDKTKHIHDECDNRADGFGCRIYLPFNLPIISGQGSFPVEMRLRMVSKMDFR